MFGKSYKVIILVVLLTMGLSALNGCVSQMENSPQTRAQDSTKTGLSDLSLTATHTLTDQGFVRTNIPPTAPGNMLPTYTPLPTYPPSEARQIVMDLYTNNPCRLPCWWGIEPGRTEWPRAWQFLERFSINRQPWETLLLESQRLPGFVYFRAILDIHQTNEESYYHSLNDLTFLINVESSRIDYIDVNVGNLAAYAIPEMFADYGKPEEINVFGGSSPIVSGVTVDLYYPQHGFISSHFMSVEDSKFGTETITACLQDMKITVLHLWSDNQYLDYFERLRISDYDSFSIGSKKTLDWASSMSIDSFMAESAKPQACFDFDTARLLRTHP